MVGSNAARAVRDATPTIPVVFYGNLDPVATGLVQSFARPGGNLTGVLIALRTQADAAASDTDETGRRPAGWTSRRNQLRLPPTPGPGAWRASSRLS